MLLFKMRSQQTSLSPKSNDSYHTGLGEGEKSKSQSLSRARLFVSPQTVARQAPVNGILQARIMEWVAIAFSRRSSQPRDQSSVSCITGRFFTV